MDHAYETHSTLWGVPSFMSFVLFSLRSSGYHLGCTVPSVSAQWPVEHVKNTLQNMTPPIVMTCGSNFSSGSCIHSCPLLHQGNHPDGALEVQLAGAAHLGVAGVLVADVIDAHHVVEQVY